MYICIKSYFMDKLNLINFEKYTITEDGRIFSKHFNRYLLGSPNQDEYITISLWCKDEKSRPFYYHRVIWFYFNGDIPNGLEINHVDENKSNNSLSNLELMSRGDNVRYGSRTKKASETNSKVQKGKKFTKEHLDNLRNYHIRRSRAVDKIDLLTGEILQTYGNTRLAAEDLGVKSKSTIEKACRGVYTQAYGYGWKWV